MPDRYWVGGTGTWNTTSTTNWSATSGGAGGASVPGVNDPVFFDGASGSGTVTISGSVQCAGINTTGSSLTFTNSGSASIGSRGSFTLSSAITWGGTINVSIGFGGATGTYNITTAGKTLSGFSVAGGNAVLQDALTVSGGFSYNPVTSTVNIFNANNQNVTFGTFSSSLVTSARTIIMGSGTWTGTGTGTVWNLNATGLTFNVGTANLVFTDAVPTGTRSFFGAGFTYNNLTIGGGSAGNQTFAFQGSNTFNSIISTKTVAFTIRFAAGTTTTVANWQVTGTPGNVVTINSITVGTQFNITKTGGGIISGTNYLSIRDSNATPSNTWYAGANSTNVANNTGWIFTAAPSQATGNFFLLL